jgi:uncharacterized protein DUF998
MSSSVAITGNRTRERVRTILLACGPLSALSYVGWRELAVALRWEGYSRIANAISELQLGGSPTKSFLDPWEGWVYSGLVAAFGVGVWLSAEGKWSLRVVAIAMIMPLVMAPLWAVFGEASLAAHVGLVLVGIGTWLVAMGFAAAALGKRFRNYTLVTLAVVVAFNGLALSYVADVDAGRPTPFIGLDERAAFAAYFVWQSVLAVILWHTGRTRARTATTQGPGYSTG